MEIFREKTTWFVNTFGKTLLRTLSVIASPSGEAVTTTAIGDINALDIIVKDNGNIKEIIDNTLMPSVQYIGKSFDLNAEFSDSSWQIIKKTFTVNYALTEFANSGSYTNIFADRKIIFPYRSVTSLFFNGINQYAKTATTPAALQINSNTAFYISVWVKPSNLTGLKRILSNRDSSDVKLPATFDIFFNNGNLNVYIGDTSKNIHVQSSSNFLADTWQHLLVEYSGNLSSTGIKIYKNNIDITNPTPIASDAVTVFSLPTDLTLGRNSTLASYYAGHMDELAIRLNSATTPTIRDSIYNDGKTSDLSLLGFNYWVPFGEGDEYPIISDRIADLSFTVYNMSTNNFTVDTPDATSFVGL